MSKKKSNQIKKNGSQSGSESRSDGLKNKSKGNSTGESTGNLKRTAKKNSKGNLNGDSKGISKAGFNRLRPARDVATCGIFLAVILVIGLIERMIPLDFLIPGARLGLSNIVILLSLYLFPLWMTVVIVVLKCVLLSALSGGLSAFIYSISGSLLALVIMLLLVEITKKHEEGYGIIGISVAGAAAHSTGQVAIAAVILETFGIFAYLPWLLIISVISGIAVGVAAKQLLPPLNRFRNISGY